MKEITKELTRINKLIENKKASKIGCFFIYNFYRNTNKNFAFYLAAAYLFATSFQLITLKNALI